jgi:DNA-binding LacI/PurR family transcriptional regulator
MMNRSQLVCVIVLLSSVTSIDGFFNRLFSKFSSPALTTIKQTNLIDKQTQQIEKSLLRILENTEDVGGRGAKTSPETLLEIEGSANKRAPT